MQKIPSLFQRDWEGNRQLVVNKVTPGTEWVLNHEGVATQKLDGSACAVINGVLHKRYDCKKGKPPPKDFIPCQQPDSTTGHWPGWVPVGEGPEDKWYLKAWRDGLTDGTYEICGPHFQNNPEELSTDHLVKHGTIVLIDVPTEFEALREYFQTTGKHMEGVVWHHPDGRMCKIKASDFGVTRARVSED